MLQISEFINNVNFNLFKVYNLPIIVILSISLLACNQTTNPASTTAGQTLETGTSQAVMDVGKEQPGLTALQDLGPLPDFKLTDQTGQAVSLANLKGKVWVADFFFTNCAGVCPTMTATLSKLYKELAPVGLNVLSISVDPKNDTPEKLAAYAADWQAKRDNWLFLTGEQQQIIDLSVKGFKLGLNEDPTSHSQRFILIDRQGHIRGYYRSDDTAEMISLRQSLQTLLAAKN
jgi:protein SCO1